MALRLRSYHYLLASVILALVVGWVGHHTWLEFRKLYRSFPAVEADAFHLSENLEAAVRDLNETALRFDLRHHPKDRADFHKESQELQQWIRAHQTSVSSQLERELLDQIAAAFERYWASMSALLEARIQDLPAALSQPMSELVETEAAPVIELCDQLQAAERAAQKQFMQDAHDALSWLRQLFIVLLVLLIVLVGTGAVAVYRGVIGPLHFELSKSRALAARNEKLAALGTLAAGVAHEIRNPLTAINVRLHSLQKNLVPNSSEQEDALVISQEIQRLERIVQEFLQFARPAEPKRLTVSADRLLAKVQALFRPQLEKASIRLELESVPDLWVRADPHQMEQVLINLVQNAAESIHQNGLITLRARANTVRLRGRNRSVVILEVSDTGKGIPLDVRQRMFDPFFTTKDDGTGLGLAIAARILEKHGGELECRSEVDCGATFRIVLPAADLESDETTIPHPHY